MRSCLVTLLAFSIVLASCNRDNGPNAAPVTQHYTATFNVTTGITEMRARFFYNPNNTILPDGYRITCNGVSLSTFADGNSYYYATTAAGNPDAFFELTDDAGTILENRMYSNVIPVINFDSTFLPGAISRADTLVIPFTGGPLTSGVSVSIDITQDALHYTYHHEQIAIGDSVIVFMPGDLAPLQAGSATITLSRIGPAWGLGETDAGAGGDMRYTVVATRVVTISN